MQPAFMIACQVTAPASVGAFTAVSALLPAWAVTALGSKTVLYMILKPGATVDLRTDAAEAGWTLASGVIQEIKGAQAGRTLLRSQAGAIAVEVLLYTTSGS